MTRNLYLGSSLAPATEIDPADPKPGLKFVGAVAEIYGTAVFTDFPTRAAAIADEIATRSRTWWGCRRSRSGPPRPLPTAAPPSFDFLALLQCALKSKGLDYTVAGVVNNALIGPVPLVAPPAAATSPRIAPGVPGHLRGP